MRDANGHQFIVVIKDQNTLTQTCQQENCKKNRVLFFKKDGWPKKNPSAICLACETLYLSEADKKDFDKLSDIEKAHFRQNAQNLTMRAARSLLQDFKEPLYMFPSAAVLKLLYGDTPVK